eukprot:scaffold17461_cov48-Phaeocystis_antarctica.AAC.1
MPRAREQVKELAPIGSEDDDVVITGTGFKPSRYLLPGAKDGVKFNKGGSAGAGKQHGGGEKAFAEWYARRNWGDSETECAFSHDEHCQETPYRERPKFTVCPFVLLPESYVRNEDGDPAPILAAEFKKSLRP